MKYLKLYEEFSDKNIIDFCQDKEHLVKNNISEKDFINKLIKSDDTSLLKEYYDKIV